MTDPQQQSTPQTTEPKVDYWKIPSPDNIPAHDPRLSHFQGVDRSPPSIQKMLNDAGVTNINVSGLNKVEFELVSQVTISYKAQTPEALSAALEKIKTSPSYQEAVSQNLSGETLSTKISDAISQTRLDAPLKPRPINELPLTTERKVLHETIVEVVSKYDIKDEHELKNTVEKIQQTEAYKQISTSQNASPEDIRRNVQAAITEAQGNGTRLEPLKLVPSGERVATVLVGGPATGKSTATRALANEGYDLGAKIGSDDYKAMLADSQKLGAEFGNLTHPESAYLVEEIRGRIGEMAANGRAPNFTVEKFLLQDSYAQSIESTGAKINVVGTFSDDPAVPVERNGKRGDTTGRYVDTDTVIGVPRAVAQNMSSMASNPNVELHIFNTNVPLGEAPKLVAFKERGSNTIQIYDGKGFTDFLKQTEIARAPNGPDKLYNADISTETIVQREFRKYADNGLNLSYVDNNGKVVAHVVGGNLHVNDPIAFKSTLKDNDLSQKLSSANNTHTEIGETNGRANQDNPRRVEQSNQRAEGGGGENRQTTSHPHSDAAGRHNNATGNDGRNTTQTRSGASQDRPIHSEVESLTSQRANVTSNATLEEGRPQAGHSSAETPVEPPESTVVRNQKSQEELHTTSARTTTTHETARNAVDTNLNRAFMLKEGINLFRAIRDGDGEKALQSAEAIGVQQGTQLITSEAGKEVAAKGLAKLGIKDAAVYLGATVKGIPVIAALPTLAFGAKEIYDVANDPAASREKVENTFIAVVGGTVGAALPIPGAGEAGRQFAVDNVYVSKHKNPELAKKDKATDAGGVLLLKDAMVDPATEPKFVGEIPVSQLTDRQKYALAHPDSSIRKPEPKIGLPDHVKAEVHQAGKQLFMSMHEKQSSPSNQHFTPTTAFTSMHEKPSSSANQHFTPTTKKTPDAPSR